MAKKQKPLSIPSQWLPCNRAENQATTFSNNPEADRRPLIGARGETTSCLKPTGPVKIEGRLFDAIAETGFIDPGQPVEVTGLRDFKLVVKPGA